MAKTYAYLRVSSEEQDLEKNRTDILLLANRLNLGQVHFVEEKVSGTVSWKKRKIASIFDKMESEDTLLVSELSRIGRSMLEIMEVLSIAMDQKIKIYSVKGNWKLDDSIQSKILAMVFSMASEIERDLISKRTKEALAAKKAQGIKLGRPKGKGKSKLDPFKLEIEALLNNGSTQKFIAKRYNTTEGNLYKWLKRNNISRKL
jgi:Site-specific recombinases, DNA invertase Pin homologs